MLHQLIRKDHLKQGRHYVGDGVDIAQPRFSQVKAMNLKVLYTPSRLRSGHSVYFHSYTLLNKVQF